MPLAEAPLLVPGVVNSSDVQVSVSTVTSSAIPIQNCIIIGDSLVPAIFRAHCIHEHSTNGRDQHTESGPEVANQLYDGTDLKIKRLATPRGVWHLPELYSMQEYAILIVANALICASNKAVVTEGAITRLATLVRGSSAPTRSRYLSALL